MGPAAPKAAEIPYVGHRPFGKAETFPQLAAARDAWREDYNAQRHWAHEKREDGRRSPQNVLGFYTALLRHREQDLHRAFFSTRSTRVLDALGYVRFLDWKLYGEEALARREAAVWMQPGSVTLEYGGETLSAYDVELARETGKPKAVGGARLFETSHRRSWPQARLFALEEAGWLTAMKLEGYTRPGARRGRWPFRRYCSRIWMPFRFLVRGFGFR